MASNIQPYLLAVFALNNNGATRQLLAVSSERLHASLRDETIRIGGQKIVDWYGMANVDAVLSLIRTTKLMGGIAYDLPIIENMGNVQPYILAVYALNNKGATRQLLAVSSERLHASLRDEAIRIGGLEVVDWYAMANVDAVLSLVRTTKLMGGTAYDLPII